MLNELRHHLTTFVPNTHTQYIYMYWATPPYVLGACTQYILLSNTYIFKKCHPIHICSVAQYICSVTQDVCNAPQYIYPIHIWCCPIHYAAIDTGDTYVVLPNTYMGFLWIVPKYVLGTRNIYWVYVLGNTPYVLDNTFSYVLGNTNVLQDIYPIHMLCDPIYIDAIQHIYPIHIFIYIGVRICLGEHLYICIGQP